MTAVDVIKAKRDGAELTPAQIDAFVSAAARGTWEPYQLSALLMAICCRGMTASETAHLTRAMADSGRRIDLSDIPGPKVDKHSTGGVGDKTSLILGPLAAACGVRVPMMSGRGLGHTGGTLDKLEAIPGFRVDLSIDEFRAAVRDVGIGMMGQTADVAPADKALYALRDVTGTVESIPLITASILSKKLAEGIDALVLDVKVGRGAFMKALPQARELAESLVTVGRANGLKVEAVITNMDSPLGQAVGHANEVWESIAVLKGRGPADTTELSVHLAARMVRLGGLAATLDEAEAKVRAAIADGSGLAVFRRMVERQGGDPRVLDDDTRLPAPPAVGEVRAGRDGFVAQVRADAVGAAVRVLGGGRERVTDAIDHAVGVEVCGRPGDPVRVGDVLFRVGYRTDRRWADARPLLEGAVVIGDTVPAPAPLTLDVIA
jgi:pyrimidine-nucleoside phosphorylase